MKTCLNLRFQTAMVIEVRFFMKKKMKMKKKKMKKTEEEEDDESVKSCFTCISYLV